MCPDESTITLSITSVPLVFTDDGLCVACEYVNAAESYTIKVSPDVGGVSNLRAS